MSDVIKQCEDRQKLCRTLNKNINVTENTRQNKENTILFIGMSKIDIGKLMILNQLLKCIYKCIIGIDKKYYKNDNEFNNDIKKHSDYIKKNLNDDINKFINIPKTYLDNNELIKSYGKKIENFNGRWQQNPSKLGSIEWFNKSEYEYMWYIEDDVYCKNFDLFLDDYTNMKDDLICNCWENGLLPHWFNINWRVGDKAHGIVLFHLYVCRYSKQYSNNFFKFLKETKNTSHHELFVPYVLHYYHLHYTPLLEKHKEGVYTNDGKVKFFNISDNDVNKKNAEIFHPFKIKK